MRSCRASLGRTPCRSMPRAISCAPSCPPPTARPCISITRRRCSWASGPGADDAVEAGLRLARTWRPSLVHLHTSWLWPVAEAIRNEYGVPVVFTVHSLDRAEYERGGFATHWEPCSSCRAGTSRSAWSSSREGSTAWRSPRPPLEGRPKSSSMNARAFSSRLVMSTAWCRPCRGFAQDAPLRDRLGAAASAEVRRVTDSAGFHDTRSSDTAHTVRVAGRYTCARSTPTGSRRRDLPTETPPHMTVKAESA